jgi:hypothetical protein
MENVSKWVILRVCSKLIVKIKEEKLAQRLLPLDYSKVLKEYSEQ